MVSAATAMCAVFSLYVWVTSSLERRQGFSLGPLGLRFRRGRQPKKHAIAEIGRHATFEAWASTLNRSCRSTMRKQQPKAFKKHTIQHKLVAPKDLGWPHFLVVFEHEKRSTQYTFLRVVLLSLGRFFVAKCMVGAIDEFYSDGRLVGWSVVV